MKEVILKLLSEISGQSSPISPSTLKAIFSKTALPTGEIPEELTQHYALLSKLAIYADHYIELTGQMNELEGVKANYNQLLTRSDELQVELTQLKEDRDSTKSSISDLYKSIMQLSTQLSQDKGPLANAENVDEFGDTQKSLVAEYHELLKKTYKSRVLNRAKLEYVYKMSIINEHLKSLALNGLDLDSDFTLEMLTESLEQYIDDTQSLTDLKLQWEGDKQKGIKGLQNRLPQEITAEEIQEAEEEKTEAIEEIDTELKSIPVKLDQIELSSEEKTKLSEAFNTSSDIPALIDSYSNQIDGVLSYANLGKWLSWGMDADYNNKQKKFKDSTQYLELLNSKRKLEEQRAEIEKQLMQVKQLLTDSSPSKATSSQGNERLVSDATDLVNALPEFSPSIILTSNSPITDFYVVLINEMPKVLEQEEKNQAVIKFLRELIPVKRNITELARNHKLTLPIDSSYPSLQEAEQAKDTIGKPDPMESLFMEQHKNCETYFSMATKLEEIITKIKEASKNAKDLSKQIRESNFHPEFESSLLQIPGDLLNASKRVDDTLLELQQLPDVKPEVVVYSLPIKIITDYPEIKEPGAQSVTPEETRTVLSDSHSDESNESEDTTTEEIKIGEPKVETPNVVAKPIVLGLPPEKLQEVIAKMEQPTDSIKTDNIVPTVLSSSAPVQTEQKPATVLVPTHSLNKDDSNTNSSVGLSLVQVVTSTPSEEDPMPGEDDDDYYSDGASDVLSLSSSDPSTDLIAHKNSKTPSVLVSPQPAVTTVKSQQPEDPSTDDDIIANETGLQLIDYHKLNISLIPQYSQVIQNWYQELHSAITKNPLDNYQNLKAVHLLKDILFELQYKKDLSTIEAYMRLCPKPSEDFSVLLKFKSPVVLPDLELDEEDIFDDYPEDLKKLQEQFIHLKADYPVEAKLFLQAIQSFVLIKESIAQSKGAIKPDLIPKLTDDPRFDPLKRHRGFLKIWELVEDMFKWLVGKLTQQPEYEYKNRPCFFRTRSTKLLEEADNMLAQKLLAETQPESSGVQP